MRVKITHNYRRRFRVQGSNGFTLMEVVLAMSVFLMMTLLFGAAIPVALHATQQGSSYTQASIIAQHKIDQLRTVAFSSLSNSSALQSQGFIDAVNSDGTYDFSSTTADNLAAFFPSGTTGTLAIQADTSTGTMQGSVYDITVTIAWPSSASHAGSYTLKNKIINY